MLFNAVVTLAGLLAVFATAQGDSDLLVKTNHFTIQGIVEPNATNVRTFRRVPYAEAPVDEGRFKPPVTKKPVSEILDGTRYGPSCIQLNNGQPTAYTEHLPGFLLAPGAITDEDCLSLILWAPRAAANQALPVIIYIPGGGFTGGGANSPYKYGANIVRDNQDVIVISIK
jgi:cholinesterase